MLAGSKTRRTVPAVRGPQERAQALGQGRLDWSTWPRYEAAALGFREYWYPLAWARQVGRRPIRATLLGEELVLEPFNRLIEGGHLMAYKYEGFWRAMDTLRDRQVLEDMVERGETPWRVQTAPIIKAA